MEHLDTQTYEQILPTKLKYQEAMLDRSSVTGMTIAFKETKGQSTQIPSIVIFVSDKGNFAESERIPSELDGVATDVVQGVFEVNPPHKEDDGPHDIWPSIVGGCGTAPARVDDWYGTVGLTVVDAESSEPRFLSNWHIFCAELDWATKNKEITQPSRDKGGRDPEDVIGEVTEGVLGEVLVGDTKQYVDCAVASSNDTRTLEPTVKGIGAINGSCPAQLKGNVNKYGATTHLTQGVVEDLNFSVKLDYTGVGKVTFHKQILIRPATSGLPFASGGDSGSAIINHKAHAVGLLFAVQKTSGYALANPIDAVLNALGVTVPMTT